MLKSGEKHIVRIWFRFRELNWVIEGYAAKSSQVIISKFLLEPLVEDYVSKEQNQFTKDIQL